MNRLRRIARHLWLDESDTRRALPVPALARLQARVAHSEQRHSGEIRVVVEAALPLSYLWRGLGARDRAIMQFSKLRVWDTEANNGVLIYLLLADRAIEIVADRGLGEHIDPTGWRGIVGSMRTHFRAGRIELGLDEAIDAVDALLVKRFPRMAGDADRNELPDAPLLD
jgi:uncharacterized membrane protein